MKMRIPDRDEAGSDARGACVLISALVLCLSLQCVLPYQASAKTWFVERDGSGEYTVIQDAVDVAASGDTIRIGPGRYDDKHYVITPGWSDSVRVHIIQQELTIIGSGAQTIIGQVHPWDPDQGMHKGIAASDSWGNAILRVESLYMEDMRDAIYTSYTSGEANRLEVRDCTFRANDIDLVLIGENGIAEIVNCTFSYLAGSEIHAHAWDHNEVIVRGCTFEMWANRYGSQALGFWDVQNVIIEDCDFIEGTLAVDVIFGGPVAITNCLFDGQDNAAISPFFLADIELDGCTFRNQNNVVVSSVGDNRVVLTNSIIESVSDCAFLVNFAGSITVNDCDLAKGERGVVWVLDQSSCSHSGTLDMTNNFWGTDNPDSIQSWIRDQNDSASACYLVDYEPFRTGSVPTEKKSLGGLKALYLGR